MSEQKVKCYVCHKLILVSEALKVGGEHYRCSTHRPRTVIRALEQMGKKTIINWRKLP